MTRQEQKAVRELSEMISKNLKVIAREHGFKVVSDCAYKVLDDFLYEVLLSAPPVRCGTAIRAVVSVLQYRAAQNAGNPGGTLGEGTETALCREI